MVCPSGVIMRMPQRAAVAVQIHDCFAETLVPDLLGLVWLTERHGCFCDLEQALLEFHLIHSSYFL